MKFFGLVLCLLSVSGMADAPLEMNHHVSKFQIWCDVAGSPEEAIAALNAKIESGGHQKHHLRVLHVSAPSITVDGHGVKHHQNRACVTVQFSQRH